MPNAERVFFTQFLSICRHLSVNKQAKNLCVIWRPVITLTSLNESQTRFSFDHKVRYVKLQENSIERQRQV